MNELIFTFNFSPGPDAIWIIPLTLLFILLISYEIKKGKIKSRIGKILGAVIIMWNIFAIYSQLFYMHLPVSNTVLSYMWYFMIGVGILYSLFAFKLEPKT